MCKAVLSPKFFQMQIPKFLNQYWPVKCQGEWTYSRGETRQNKRVPFRHLTFRRGNPLPPKPCRQFQKSLDPCRWNVAVKSGCLENLLLKKVVREEKFSSERMSKKKQFAFCVFNWHCYLWNCISYFPLESSLSEILLEQLSPVLCW